MSQFSAYCAVQEVSPQLSVSMGFDYRQDHISTGMDMGYRHIVSMRTLVHTLVHTGAREGVTIVVIDKLSTWISTI